MLAHAIESKVERAYIVRQRLPYAGAGAGAGAGSIAPGLGDGKMLRGDSIPMTLLGRADMLVE
jgi:hypothetical protein